MVKKYSAFNKSTKDDHPVSECKKWDCKMPALKWPVMNWKKEEEKTYTKDEHPPSMCDQFGCDAIQILIDPNQN